MIVLFTIILNNFTNFLYNLDVYPKKSVFFQIASIASEPQIKILEKFFSTLFKVGLGEERVGRALQG